MPSGVTCEDIAAGLKRLGLASERVAVHSSLSRFGHVAGGAGTVTAALQQTCRTVMMPAFCWDSNAPPPAGDRPEQNGCDYAFYDNWDTPPRPFIVDQAGINPKMGTIAGTFVSMPGVRRSDHAWHSWACWGDGAEGLVVSHGWDTTNLPLERLTGQAGWVVLLGVGLSACTAVHIAEERSGRRPFIRWATDKNGQVRRVRAAGCANGFDQYYPACRHLFNETRVGGALLLAVRLDMLIETMAREIMRSPETGQCSPECLRCNHACAGGPEI